MKIAPFGVEIWMNDYETRCRYDLAETCSESLTVDELLVMTNSRETSAYLHQEGPEHGWHSRRRVCKCE